MRKSVIVSLLMVLVCSIIFIPAGRASTTPSASRSFVLQAVIDKLATYKIRDLRQLTGRKLTMKEKLSFWLLKKQLAQKREPGFINKIATKLLVKKKAGNAGDSKGNGQTAFIFGIAGAVLLVAGFFVPYIIIPSLISAILAIALGTVAYKSDPNDAKAKAGKLLGWITLGLFALILIVAVIALSNSSWW